MRKDLAAARMLAAEKHDLDYFKEILKEFVEQREADRLAKEAAKAEKKAAVKKTATPKKSAKSAKTVSGEDEDDDVEMPDAAELESEGAEASTAHKKTKKRKAEEVKNSLRSIDMLLTEVETPQGNDSVKKPRTTIKLNMAKSTNGSSTPKTPKEATPKVAKPKKSKATPKAAETPAASTPKVPELSAEEKRAKKEVFCQFTFQMLGANRTPERDSFPPPQAPEGPLDPRPRPKGG